MTLRLPGKPSSDLWRKSPAGVLDYEIAQETASALGRHGRALEAAVKDLAEFEDVFTQHDEQRTASLFT